MPDTIRILIVEDHEQYSEALAEVFATDSRFHVCGIALDGPAAMLMMPDALPDLVLTDLNLPCGSALGLIPKLRLINPAAKFLMLSQEDPRTYGAEAKRIGANGVLRKGTKMSAVLQAVQDVAAGGEIFPTFRVN